MFDCLFMVTSNHHLGDQGDPGSDRSGGLRSPEGGWFLVLAVQREVAWRRRQ